MNDDERGRSPCEHHVAVATPPDCTFGRERRARFFSSAGVTTRFTTVAAAATAAAATFATVFTTAFALLVLETGAATTGLFVGFVAFAGAAPFFEIFGFGAA